MIPPLFLQNVYSMQNSLAKKVDDVIGMSPNHIFLSKKAISIM